MIPTPQSCDRHILTLFVDNETGILARIAGLFAAGGHNIDSLSVAGVAGHLALCRITIATHGEPVKIGQMLARLERLIPVYQVVDIKEAGPHIVRDLALVKIANTGTARAKALRLAAVFHAKVVDDTPHSLIFELADTPKKIDRFIPMMRSLGLVEVGRTGVVGLMKGPDAI